jgi:hypothetical protein
MALSYWLHEILSVLQFYGNNMYTFFNILEISRNNNILPSVRGYTENV